MKKTLFLALAAAVAIASCGKGSEDGSPSGGDDNGNGPGPEPNPETAEYVRVDETLDDWTGEYLLVYEAQAAGNGTYGAKTVLMFDGSADPPLDGAGNVIVLSPTTPGTPEELAEITGSEVERSATEVTVKGGRIEADGAKDKCRLIITAVEGGYAIRTTGGYYIGGGTSAGNLSASKTFTAPSHVHTISIGDSDSNVAGNAGVTLHNCALIVSGASQHNALRVNAGTGRFGYWGVIAASGLWGQHPVALYKRSEPGPEIPGLTDPESSMFTVKNSIISIGSQGGDANILVAGNVEWSAAITGTGATLALGSESGNGGGNVTVNFSENRADEPRVVKVTVSTTADAATRSFQVTITQKGLGFEPVPLHPRYVRIVALGDPGPTKEWSGKWMLSRERRPEFIRDYYAEDVLEWIEDLKPYCLERFISGYQGASIIPKREGGNMTVTEFLNKAIQAGGEGCHICPKLDLTWLRAEAGTNNYRNFWEGAQLLYDMDLVTPIRSVSLDCWNNYKEFLTEQGLNQEQQAAAMKEVFDRLREIGFEEVGVNLTGAGNWGPAENVLDFVNFNINTTTWAPTLSDGIRNNKAIKSNPDSGHDTFLLYIDYPGPYQKFVSGNTPDGMADIYTKNIWPQQAEQGFVFVYSLSNAEWDPFAHITKADGPYKGKSMYDITKECLFRTE